MRTEALHFEPDGALRWGDLEVPSPGPGELAVDIAATGLNRADLLQRRGLYPAPPGAPATVPGLEYAGVVAERGPGAERHAVGARVMGIVAGGALARRVVVHEEEALEVPSRLSLEEAAAIPEAFLTAHDALFTQAGLRAGERVLIHAVASGVGSAAVQLARRIGARAVGTTRTADKIALLSERVGFAVDAVVPQDGRFADAVGPVDVVLDLVGASYFEQSLALLARSGRMIVVGTMGGVDVELPLARLLTRRLTVRGTVLRSRDRGEKIAVASAFSRDAATGLADGSLRPVVDRVFPMAEVEAAWGRMAENQSVGKVVVRW